MNFNVDGYYIIHPGDDEAKVRFTAAESEPPLDTLQTSVGGYIEMVPFWTHRNSQAICNEEGKLQGLPSNALANLLWEGYPDDVLVGTIIILCGKARLT